ncbi:MAG: efflux RND transporter periplasmic adaptor subunit [Opitutae bacterium]|nr:efflux RND transporter periplasmic adaptor subunit [Opitutae bacterium]
MKSPLSSPLRLAFVGALLFSGALGFAPSLLRAAEKQLYTCGMHPQIVRDKPGNCPICGMKLQPVRANTAGGAKASAPSGARKVKYYKSTMIPGQISQTPAKDTMGMDMVPVYEGEDASAESNIQIDAATTQRMNLKTALVGRGPVKRDFRTVGTVAYNEEGLRDITTKYEGWLEKLHVNATWTPVKAGDPLFDIYSPDLYNAQLNYLVATRSEGAAGGALTRAALARLRLFDLPEEFIAEVARTDEARRTYTFRAPADGVVIEKMAVAGQMMKAGEKIYRLADLSTVWVHAQIYEKDLPFVQEGQPAEVRTSYGQQRSFAGAVRLLLPQVEEQTRAATARLVLPNPDRYLRPGMFTDVRFTAQLAESAVLVPDMAVLRSGERNTVFIAKDGGSFEPRAVQLGARSEGNFYEVLSGLSEGDRVVTSGQFMLDSESQLREAIQKMLRNASAPDTAPAQPAPAASDHAHGAAPAAKPEPIASLPPPTGADGAAGLLQPLAFASADAAAALAADDLAAYQRQLPGLRSALAAYFAGYAHAAHGPLGQYPGGLPDANGLAEARRAFERFSTAVADLARENQLNHSAGLRIFECPMAPETGRARWLQRTAGTKNPFFGLGMPGCGDEIAAPADAGKPSAFALPPGHPPLDAATFTAFDALRREPAAPAEGACGSCGMSAAEMAAGEPCEHDKK